MCLGFDLGVLKLDVPLLRTQTRVPANQAPCGQSKSQPLEMGQPLSRTDKQVRSAVSPV
jgi:hypothetical protein